MDGSSLWGGNSQNLVTKKVGHLAPRPVYQDEEGQNSYQNSYHKIFHPDYPQSPSKPLNGTWNEYSGSKQDVYEKNSDSNITPNFQKTAKVPHYPVTDSVPHQFENITEKRLNKNTPIKQSAVTTKIKLFAKDIKHKLHAPLKNCKQEVLNHKPTKEITKKIRFQEIRPIDSRGDASLSALPRQDSVPATFSSNPKIMKPTSDTRLAPRKSTKRGTTTATQRVASAPVAAVNTSRRKPPPTRNLTPNPTRISRCTEPDSRSQRSAHMSCERNPHASKTNRESTKLRKSNVEKNLDKNNTRDSSVWKQNEKINTGKNDTSGATNNAHHKLTTLFQREEESCESADEKNDLKNGSTWELILSPNMYRKLSQPGNIIIVGEGKKYIKQIENVNVDSSVKTTALVRDRSRAIKEKLERQKTFNEKQSLNQVNKTMEAINKAGRSVSPPLVIYLEEDPTYAPLRNIKLDFSTTRITLTNSNTSSTTFGSTHQINVTEASLSDSYYTSGASSITGTSSEIQSTETQTTDREKPVDTNTNIGVAYNSPKPTETRNKTKIPHRNYQNNSASDIMTTKKKSAISRTAVSPSSVRTEGSLLPPIEERPSSHKSIRSLPSLEPRGKTRFLRSVMGVKARGDSPCIDPSLRVSSPLQAAHSEVSRSRPNTCPVIQTDTGSNIRPDIHDAGWTSRKEVTAKLPPLSNCKAMRLKARK